MSAAGQRRTAQVVAALVVAAGAVVALSLLVGAGPYQAVGTADPGAVVRVGTPLLRLVNDLAAALCIGSLAFAAFFTSPGAAGPLSAHGYAAVRNAGRCAAVWVVAAAALVVFDAANTAGLPVSGVVQPDALPELVSALEGPKGWLLEAVVVLAVAAGCRAALHGQSALGLLALAVFAVLPPLATGHASSDTGHDIATAALMIHVPAAVLWAGVLIALVAHVRRTGPLPQRWARRYARMTTACWVVVAASGVATSWQLVHAAELLTTPYGLVLLANLLVLVALGAGAAALRRRAWRGGDPSWPALVRSAVAEFGALAVGLALSAALAHLTPPGLVDRQVTGQETLLGYTLPGPPTLPALALSWRIDVFFAPLAVLLAAAYLAGVVRLRRRGSAWPRGRTAVWLGGCVLLLVATSSGIGRYAPAMFSVHLAHHMLVGMLVPVLLALGGPLSLVRKTSSQAESGPHGESGPGEWLGALAATRLVRWLTHPAVALVLFVGGPFLLYFTSLFDAAMRFHWAQQLITACFLVIGCLFAWVVVGVDELPRPLPPLGRLGMLLAAMPGDALLAVAVMDTHRVIGNGPAGYLMYDALHLPWVELLTDQWLGGVAALVIGEVSLLVALAAVLARWGEDVDESGPGGYRALLAERAHHSAR